MGCSAWGTHIPDYLTQVIDAGGGTRLLPYCPKIQHKLVPEPHGGAARPIIPAPRADDQAKVIDGCGLGRD
jgi:hypothetical protein